MSIDPRSDIYAHLPAYGPGRAEHTRRAVGMLPPLLEGRILDVGCGRGGPALELARMGAGLVVGVDIDLAALRVLRGRAREAGLEGRVGAVQGSMEALGFCDSAFDVVWAEGSVFAMGLEPALRAWRRLLRPGGVLVIHDSAWLRPDPSPEVRAAWEKTLPGVRTAPETVARIAPCGFELLGHFALPEDAWWWAWYGPLEARIEELRAAHGQDPQALAILDGEQREVELYKATRQWLGSAFFVMRRND